MDKRTEQIRAQWKQEEKDRIARERKRALELQEKLMKNIGKDYKDVFQEEDFAQINYLLQYIDKRHVQYAVWAMCRLFVKHGKEEMFRTLIYLDDEHQEKVEHALADYLEDNAEVDMRWYPTVLEKLLGVSSENSSGLQRVVRAIQEKIRSIGTSREKKRMIEHFLNHLALSVEDIDLITESEKMNIIIQTIVKFDSFADEFLKRIIYDDSEKVELLAIAVLQWRINIGKGQEWMFDLLFERLDDLEDFTASKIKKGIREILTSGRGVNILIEQLENDNPDVLDVVLEGLFKFTTNPSQEIKDALYPKKDRIIQLLFDEDVIIHKVISLLKCIDDQEAEFFLAVFSGERTLIQKAVENLSAKEIVDKIVKKAKESGKDSAEQTTRIARVIHSALRVKNERVKFSCDFKGLRKKFGFPKRRPRNRQGPRRFRMRALNG